MPEEGNATSAGTKFHQSLRQRVGDLRRARPQIGRALAARQPAGRGAAAAQGLIGGVFILRLLNGAGSSRAVLLCAASMAFENGFRLSGQDHADRSAATTIG